MTMTRRRAGVFSKEIFLTVKLTAPSRLDLRSHNPFSLSPQKASFLSPSPSLYPSSQSVSQSVMDKNTVFVWDGILEARAANDDGGYDMYWHGVVVANDNSADAATVPEPPRNAFKEFVDSDLQFQVSGTAKPVDGNSKDGNKFKPFTASLTGGDGWDFGGAKNSDSEHEVLLNSLLWKGSPDQRESLVYGRGSSNEHGPFVSVGWMRPGNRVTLARRYVDASDPRASWTSDQLRDAILAQIYNEDDDTIVMPPWKCEALNA